MRLFVYILLCLLAINPVIAEQTAIVRRSATGHALTKAISLDDAINKSGLIFKGQFLGSKIQDRGSSKVRVLRFHVLEAIKGLETQTTQLELSEWAQAQSPFTTEIEIAKPYVFFFYPPSKRGFTSLIGQEQGFVDISDESKPIFAKRMLKYEKRHYAGFSGLFRQLRSIGRAKAAEIHSYTELRNLCKSN